MNWFKTTVVYTTVVLAVFVAYVIIDITTQVAHHYGL